LIIALPEMQGGEKFQSLFMFFVDFQALVEHHDGSFTVFFVSVRVVCDLVVKIGIKLFLFISCSSFTSEFFDYEFLVLSGSFDLFSGFFVGVEVELSSFLEVNLVQQEMGFDCLFEFFVSGIFLIEHGVVQQGFSPFKSFELDTKFGQIQN
jgi:hypothetical protein